jgi:hypothetical protein
LKLIVDYKHQYYKHQKYGNSPRSGKKPPSEQKSQQRRWPILKCIALSTKNALHYKRFLQVLCLATQLSKITKGSLWEAEGLEEEVKVCFISLIMRFSSSTLPSPAVPGPP